MIALTLSVALEQTSINNDNDAMPWPRNTVVLVLLFLLAVESLLSCAGRPDEAIPIIDAATSAVEGGRTAAAAWKAMARYSLVAPSYRYALLRKIRTDAS